MNSASAPHHVVLRNTLYLVVAQILVVPLSVFLNAIIARVLGPAEFGQLYLATTYATFAFLFVEWGQSKTLTGNVARQPARAGELLGSGLVWRIGASLVACIALTGICFAMGYDRSFLSILSLVALAAALTTISSACQDVFRGFERTDYSAASYVGLQLLAAVVVAPALLLGGRITTLLVAQALCAGAGAAFLLGSLRPMHVPKLRVQLRTIRELFQSGAPFLVFAVVMTLESSVDAVFLSHLASSDAIGWHAAAFKLVGLLVFPANALVAALYPTLCRLHVDDRPAFLSTSATALRTTLFAAVPVALGCGLYPELGTWVFSRESFGPAEANLRILAGFLLLVYVSMPVGTTLMAAGRQRAWAAAQLACVVVSVTFDPVLIPWFQSHTGNGGLGVAVTTVGSEVLMVASGLWLMPRGILGRSLLRPLFIAAAAGAVMATLAWLLSSVNPFLAAPLALSGYVASLWAAGVWNLSQISALRSALDRR